VKEQENAEKPILPKRNSKCCCFSSFLCEKNCLNLGFYGFFFHGSTFLFIFSFNLFRGGLGGERSEREGQQESKTRSKKKEVSQKNQEGLREKQNDEERLSQFQHLAFEKWLKWKRRRRGRRNGE